MRNKEGVAPLIGGQKATQKESNINRFFFLRFFTWARSRQVLNTVFSKTDGRNICFSSLDRTCVDRSWLPAIFAPPLIIADTMHGNQTLCYGPTLVGQQKVGDACARPFRDSQLCAPTPIQRGYLSSWVQILIPASLKFGWESNLIYAAKFPNTYRKRWPANQILVENQISQILFMLPFRARRPEKMSLF